MMAMLRQPLEHGRLCVVHRSPNYSKIDGTHIFQPSYTNIGGSMKTITLCILLLAAVSSVAQAKPDGTAEKPFAEGGQIRMELGVGDYEIVSGNSDRIQIEWVTGTSSSGGTPAEIEVNGSKAHITTTDTSSHFHATIKVPKSADLEIHQNGGGLRIGVVKGNMDLESTTGHIVVQIVSADEYGDVDVAVGVGNLFATPFERVKKGVGKSVKWAGPGKYRLHVRLGEGDINLVPADAI